MYVDHGSSTIPGCRADQHVHNTAIQKYAVGDRVRNVATHLQSVFSDDPIAENPLMVLLGE